MGNPHRSVCYCNIIIFNVQFTSVWTQLNQVAKTSHCWECHMPVDFERLRFPLVLDPPFNAEVSAKHFEIVYHTNCHYNSIVCAETGAPCTSPPTVIEQVTIKLFLYFLSRDSEVVWDK